MCVKECNKELVSGGEVIYCALLEKHIPSENIFQFAQQLKTTCHISVKKIRNVHSDIV